MTIMGCFTAAGVPSRSATGAAAAGPAAATTGVTALLPLRANPPFSGWRVAGRRAKPAAGDVARARSAAAVVAGEEEAAARWEQAIPARKRRAARWVLSVAGKGSGTEREK